MLMYVMCVMYCVSVSDLSDFGSPVEDEPLDQVVVPPIFGSGIPRTPGPLGQASPLASLWSDQDMAFPPWDLEAAFPISGLEHPPTPPALDAAGGVDAASHHKETWDDDAMSMGDASIASFSPPPVDMGWSGALVGFGSPLVVHGACDGAAAGAACGGSGGHGHMCDKCGKVFKLKHQLAHHVSTVHLGARPHACPHCPKSFAHPTSLLDHVSATHESTPRHECSGCGRRFSSASNRNRHMQQCHHPSSGSGSV